MTPALIPLAIGRRLARFPGIRTLGPRPNLDDYPPGELESIRRAARIYYPTALLAGPLAAMGKDLFPSLACHLLEGDKIKQLALFELLGLAHPRTRIFYGRQKKEIRRYFDFPLVAKVPRASALGRGVRLVRGTEELEQYLAGEHPAYIQEYLPLEGDVRVVVIGYEPVCSYWRRPAPGEFRSNLAQGGRADFEGVPRAAVELAVEAARAAGLSETGMDVVMHQGRPLLLEFTMKYGLTGPRLAGLDPPALVARGILAGEL